MEKNISTIIDYFIYKSNQSWDQLTHLKLQKLIYYTQAWFLANCKKSLFKEDFQAWVHWPVLKSVYMTYRNYKPWNAINSDINESELFEKIILISNNLWENILEYLDFIAQDYLWYTGFMLENMTHQENPWRDARKWLQPDDISDNIISKESILKYYSTRIA
jgi:uncharacterized phage-associated protein